MDRAREVVLGETNGVWFDLACVVGVNLYAQPLQSVLATADAVKSESTTRPIFLCNKLEFDFYV